MLRTLAQISPTDSDFGGKAQGLAKIFRAGLPVPDAVVIPGAAYREALLAQGGLPTPPTPPALESIVARLTRAPLPPALATQLAAQTVARPFAVRSSASCEDEASSLAPGVFLSRRHVAPAELHEAIREVWASLLSPTAQAYLATRGLTVSSAQMAVIVQHDVGGPLCLSGTVYTRDPGDAGAPRLLLEIASVSDSPALVVLERPSLRVILSSPLLADRDAIAIAGAALACEAELGRPADVEWVLGVGLWLVQARPLLFLAPRRIPFPDDAVAFSRAEQGVRWTWDAVHNPDPLSPAQEGLVAFVDAAKAVPFRQRVVQGYLYSATPAPRPRAKEALHARMDDEVSAHIERALVPLDAPTPALETALRAYLAFYRLYAGELSPALADARRSVLEFLQKRLGPVEAAQAAFEFFRGAAAASLAYFLDERPAAALVPAWDVATAPWPSLPTTHAPSRVANPRAPGVSRLGPEDQKTLDGLLPIARAAARLAEADDVYFARAQAGVRRALFAVAQRFGLSLADITHLPLAEVRAFAESGSLAPDARARAAEAQAERQRRRLYTPPFIIADGAQIFTPPKALSDAALRGRGVGGRARGHVVRVHPEAPPTALPRDTVLVTATVIPAMAPLLAAAVALVSEQGGLLGHGAALARELGLPCVVGATGATLHLQDGDEVWVDGEEGLVLRLPSPRPPLSSAPILDP